MITRNPMQLKAFIKNIAAEKNISAQLVNLLNLKPTRVKELLSEMIIDGIIVAEGANTGTEFTN